MTTKAAITRLESLTYTTPARCQGQIVERSYTGVADGEGGGWIVERVHDRGDGQITYYSTPWEDGMDPASHGDFVSDWTEIEDGDELLRHIG